MSQVTRIMTATAAAVVMLLTACGDDSRPVTLPSATKTALGAVSPDSTTGSRTPSISNSDEPLSKSSNAPLPTVAATTTDSVTSDTAIREIESAVHAYYEALNVSLDATDATVFRRTFNSSCKPCSQSANMIDEVAKTGGRLSGARYDVRRIRVHDVTDTLGAAEVTYRVSSYNLIDSDGEVADRFPVKLNRVDISLVKHNDVWVIVNAVGLGV